MILVVSSPADSHAVVVIECLRARGAVVELLDLAEYPQHFGLDLNYTDKGETLRLIFPDRTVDLAECGAVWWRRPGAFAPDPAIRRQSHFEFVQSECVEAFTGLWHALDVCWMNHPSRDEVAARKAFQLKAARQAGLATPRTLISSDSGRAQQFISELGNGRVVYKSFSATASEWRETRLVGAEEIGLIDNVRHAPVIFQEYVEAGVDLRVTMVGALAFAAAIHSQDTAYKIDFRMDMLDAKVEAVSLPEEILTGLQALMTSLGLVYGAIDMRRTPEGRYVFLEINPAGQWLFIEERTGQRITEAVSKELIALDAAGPAQAA